jgi:hypothetical protein
VEEDAYSHEEDVCIEKNPIVAYETSSELTGETGDTSVLDGYTFDESVEDEDATLDDDHMFQSTDVGYPTSFTMHNTYDEGSSRRITPTHDEDSTPYLIYDSDNEEDMIAPRQGLED